MSDRAQNEVAHGKWLAEQGPDAVWGWATPAGMRRARRRADYIVAGAKLRPGVRALEIGAGSGLFTAKFAESGAQVVAVELSSELVSYAKKRGLDQQQVTFSIGRFEDYPGKASFDAVVGSSVLHHLDLSVAFHKIFELLKPGGLMSFAEPNMLNPQVFLERHFRQFFPSVSPDETAFVRWKLAQTLRACGFMDISITPFDWLHPATPPVAIGLVSALGRLIEALPGLREFSGSLAISARRPA